MEITEMDDVEITEMDGVEMYSFKLDPVNHIPSSWGGYSRITDIQITFHILSELELNQLREKLIQRCKSVHKCMVNVIGNNYIIMEIIEELIKMEKFNVCNDKNCHAYEHINPYLNMEITDILCEFTSGYQ